MKNSLVKSRAAVISNKNRSVDHQELCLAGVSNEGSGKAMSGVGDDDVKKTKRRNRRDVGFNSIEPKVKKSRNSLPVISGSVKSDGPVLEIGQNLNRTGGLGAFSLSLDGIGNAIQIPRKPRGSVGIKSHVPKPSASSSSVDQIVELNSDIKNGTTATPSSSQNAKKGREQSIIDKVNGGDASSRKGQSHGKKRKGLASASLENAEKAQPAVDHGRCNSEDSRDDEENLEQNAARMLSSRFDPYCTGPSKSKSSLSHSGGDSCSHVENLQGGSECASAGDDSRILRPRYTYKEKGYARKRRHFYEIAYRDNDARWYLKKRIKVFLPSDERWYHGLVNEYDEERKLHEVIYNDRDKEWISLQNERFMLLLLRSEVTDVEKPLDSGSDDKLIDKTGKDLTMSEVDTNCGSLMDSEPLISWLARSSNRAKSPSALKKPKTSHPSPSDLPQSSRNVTMAHGITNGGLLEKETNIVCFHKSADRLPDAASGGESMLDHRTNPKENGSPIVYFRRRFRKKKDGSSCMPLDNSEQRSLMSVADRSQILVKKNVFSYCLDPDKMMWSIGSDGMLKLNLALVPSKEFVTQLSLPVRPLLDFSIGSETFRFLHLPLLLEYGSIVTTWPNVYLEMLFVDNEVGLRFFLIEGCLKQAVAFISLVLTVFCEPNKLREPVDLQMPVTSIRFKLSCIQDLRKQLVFSFYSFSKLNHSHWLYLDSMFQKHCLFDVQLPLPECTLENIKVLQGRSKQIPIGSDCKSSFQGTGTKSFQDIIPIGLSKSGNRYTRHSLSNDAKHRMLPFSLSFSAAPTFFCCLHLKLLMESSIASVRLGECNHACSLEPQGNTCKSTTNDWVAEQCSEFFPQVAPKSTSGTSLSDEWCFGCFSCSKARLGTHPSTASMNCGRTISSLHYENQIFDAARTYTCSKVTGRTETDVIGQSQNLECNNIESERILTKTKMLTSFNQASPVVSGDSNHHDLSSMNVEIPAIDLAKSNADGRFPGVQRASDFTSTLYDGIVFSPKPVGPKSLCTSKTRNLSSLPLGEISPVLHGERTNIINNGFGNGPRKARTQVHYALPFRGSEFSSKHKPLNPNGHPFRRIRRANEKRTPGDSKGSLRNLELLACDANVLITQGDRGWRESGAQVVLELADHEWRLAVKFSGSTKYSHKVDHVFLPGSTNRHTHAMMWKGGKDWALEFPDRSQWTFFKEMHEECYNWNIRAASVKNIPIPGVRLVEEFEDNTADYSFTRSSPRYIRQFETDIDMAMNPSKTFYDMDSEDELWILKNKKSFQSQEDCNCVMITDETFEKTMDMLEKFAYAQQRDQLTVDEIEKVAVGVAPTAVIHAIYQHWQHKRKRTGMPLIRHLQPPSWERYQKKIQEWNQLMAKANTITACGGKGKAPPVEKPVMFAFCLKPRGLEVPNKGSKHRSQKKLRVSGHSHALVGDQDGRRLNSFTVGDEKATFLDISPEHSDNFSMLQTSTRINLPSDAGSPDYFSLNNDTSDLDNHHMPYKNKSKKIGALMPRSNLHLRPSYNQRTLGKRNGVQRQNMELSDWPSQKLHQSEVYTRHGMMQLGVRDLDEFRLRGAPGVAQHASNIARFKRDKAQRLLSRADFAIQVAVSALMAADAVKASYCPGN